MSSAPDPPLLRVVAGNPTAEELAAVLVVLAGRAPPAPDPAARVDGWSAYWRTLRAPLVAGPGAWRRSGNRT